MRKLGANMLSSNSKRLYQYDSLRLKFTKMANSKEAAAKQFAHMQRIYKSYFSITSHKRIFGSAYNSG